MIPIVSINDIPGEKQIFEDAWKLVKKYYYISKVEDEKEEETHKN